MSLTLYDNGTTPIVKVVSPDGNYFVYLSTGLPCAKKKGPKPITQKKLSREAVDNIATALLRGLTLDELVSQINLPEEMPRCMPSFVVEPGERIEILPSKHPERVYASGPTGAGKSWVVGQYARNYQRMFPDNDIYLFVRQGNDPAFKAIKGAREIVIDAEDQEEDGKTLDDLAEELKEKGIKDFPDSLVVFDDLDNLSSITLSKVLHKLCDDLMCNGRKKNIWVAYIGHLTLRGNATKVILNECAKVFLFPSGTGKRGAKNFLKEYAGLENKDIQKLVNIKDSRWIMISRNVPCYIATEKGISIM